MKELRKTIQLIGIFVFLISISLLMIGVNSQENNNYEVKEDNEGNKIIKVKDKTYIIPRSIDIKEGVGGIVFVNEGEDKKFEFLGNNILLIKGAEVEVTSTSNGQEIDLRGRGEITTEWNHLPKIKNAKLKLDKDNNIIFAEFESTGNEEYEFEFNDKIYSFRTEKGSKVLFDPKEKVIKSDKVIVKINGKEISGEKFSIYLGEKEVVEGENTIIITDDKIEAIGKVKVETDSFSYEGLIDSAKLSVDIRDGVENIKIEGEEDRSKEEGGIAKFSKKY
ncbi:hypothetical protein CMI42_01600, partial [Candidatus Pacearchaeota archaeon]|nr:hypothetical protein [Candidatus Pacearchaeota archaeon]